MKMTRRLAVTFISRDPARRPTKYAVDVPKHGSVKELRVPPTAPSLDFLSQRCVEAFL
jgi:hypothetical protein